MNYCHCPKCDRQRGHIELVMEAANHIYDASPVPMDRTELEGVLFDLMDSLTDE